jgi:hypothetical protein
VQASGDKRLGIPARLERRLSTTNAIENVIGSMRRISARVKRWRDGKMILRWTVAAIADAATRFRRAIGARDGMTQLVRALECHEGTKAPVDSTTTLAQGSMLGTQLDVTLQEHRIEMFFPTDEQSKLLDFIRMAAPVRGHFCLSAWTNRCARWFHPILCWHRTASTGS